MGNSGAKLIVKLTDKSATYLTGDRLEGTIYLIVEHELIYCNQLQIKLQGIEKSTKANKEAEDYRIQTDQILSSKKIHEKNECVEFYNHDDCIFIFIDNKLRKGRYEYSFSILLPSNIPTSFTTTSCAIIYTLEARLDRPGSTASKSDVSHKVEIKIIKPEQRPKSIPLLIGPCTTRMTKHFCFSAGSITLAGMASLPAVALGECFKVYYTLHNHSTTRIKALTITLYEDIHLLVHKHKTSTRCILHTTCIDAAQLPESHQTNSLTNTIQPLTHVSTLNSAFVSVLFITMRIYILYTYYILYVSMYIE